MTGIDAARNGAVNVSSGRSLLRADLRTMADVFRDAGYSTGIFGKWHLGDNYPYRPQDRGFDESLWFPSSHISSLPDYWDNDYFDDVYCHNGKRERYEGYCTEVFFREAKAWIGSQAEAHRPFFAFLPTNAPHGPHYVPQEDREAMEIAFAEGEHALAESVPDHLRGYLIRFLAMIRNLDTQIGSLRDFLSERGLDRDTLLIFMTDNGSTFGPAYYNAGMRGAKCSLWEGGHRVPCFLHWPAGDLGSPREIGGLTQVQDILPTLIELCGLPPVGTPLDGVSLAGALRGSGTACEWRDVFVDQQRQVRIAERRNSYWDLAIERAGTYRFDLRRWPAESGLKLRDASPATQFTDGEVPEGVALPIARARIWIGRRWHQIQLGPDAATATFTVELAAGPARLHTWFDDEQGQPICGAYYAHVERLAP